MVLTCGLPFCAECLNTLIQAIPKDNQLDYVCYFKETLPRLKDDAINRGSRKQRSEEERGERERERAVCAVVRE